MEVTQQMRDSAVALEAVCRQNAEEINDRVISDMEAFRSKVLEAYARSSLLRASLFPAPTPR